MARAREACRSMVEEAQGLRARVLADLSKRRKVLHAQIEQLRAGRERLAETVHDVRRSIDLIADDLFAAEDNARLAAEAAGREALDRPDEGTPEELAALLLAVEAEAEAEAGGDDVESPGVAGANPGSRRGGRRVVEGSSKRSRWSKSSRWMRRRTKRPWNHRRRGATRIRSARGTIGGIAVRGRCARNGGGREDDSRSTPSSPRSGPPVSSLRFTVRRRPAGRRPRPRPQAARSRIERSRLPVTRWLTASPGPKTRARASRRRDRPDDGPPDERDPLAVRRDELTAPIVTAMGRRLKRTLQDNQNDLLDTSDRQSDWSAGLLPTRPSKWTVSHRAPPALEQAVQAGDWSERRPRQGAARRRGGEDRRTKWPSHDRTLRRKLPTPTASRMPTSRWWPSTSGSAFREWRGERIERLAADHVLAAFSAGSMSAAEGTPSAQLEWIAVAGSGDAPCPDCEDNGLNGSLRPGEEFPPATCTHPLTPVVDASSRSPPRRLHRVRPPTDLPQTPAPGLAPPAPLDHRDRRRPHRHLPVVEDVRHLLYRRFVVLLGGSPLGLGEALRDQVRTVHHVLGHLRRDVVGQSAGGRAPRPQGAEPRCRGRIRQALPRGDRSLRPLATGRCGRGAVTHRRVPGHRPVAELDPVQEQHPVPGSRTHSSIATWATSSSPCRSNSSWCTGPWWRCFWCCW